MAVSRDKQARSLIELNPEKYTLSNVEDHLDRYKEQVDFLSMGNLVIDVQKPITIPDLKMKHEDLAVPKEHFIKTRPPLTKVQLATVQLGGCGNVARPAAALGVKTGVIGYIGQDIEGEQFIKVMKEHSVNVFGVISDKRYRTDVSFIPQDKSGMRTPVTFCEHVGKYLDPNDPRVMERLIFLNPSIVQISYSGLFERGADLEGGRRLARAIKWMKDTIDTLVMVDTHTYTLEPERYEYLKPSLEVADLFVCSDDEVDLIVPQYGIKSGAHMVDKRQAFLSYLKKQYCKGNEARLYAITSAEKTLVLYYKSIGEVKQIESKNWFLTTKEYMPNNQFYLIGAGDSWKAGLNVYILHHLEEFKSGDLNIEEGVQFANLTSRLYISGEGVQAFKHYKYFNLQRLISGKKPDIDLKPLSGLYKALDKTF